MKLVCNYLSLIINKDTHHNYNVVMYSTFSYNIITSLLYSLQKISPHNEINTLQRREKNINMYDAPKFKVAFVNYVRCIP